MHQQSTCAAACSLTIAMASTGYTEYPNAELDGRSVHSGSDPAGSERALERESLVRLGEAVLKVACKGMAVGAALHAGLKILSGINSGAALSNPRFLRRLLDADTARFAAFVGLSGATYKLVASLLRRWSRKKHGWHAVVAGLAAGLVSLMDEPSRRRTLSHFITARALGALVITLNSRGILPSFPHFTTLMFGFCESFIVVAITQHPELVPKGYYRSVLKWSICYTDEILKACYRQPSKEFVPCSHVLHSGSCSTFVLRDFYKCLLLYVKIYATIYLLPLLLFRARKLIAEPWKAISALCQNTVVSSLFLAVSGAVMKYCLCSLRNFWGRAPPVPYWIPAVSGFAGVVGLLVERESRRLELLYYVMPQVFYGIWRLLCIKKPLGLHRIPHGSVWLFVFSFMVIMHAYEREKSSISPLINTSLHFLLGE